MLKRASNPMSRRVLRTLSTNCQHQKEVVVGLLLDKIIRRLWGVPFSDIEPECIMKVRFSLTPPLLMVQYGTP